MKTQRLLDNLSHKIQQLAADIDQSKIINTEHHRFDSQLFTHRKSNFKYQLTDYLAEIEHNFVLLTHSVNNNFETQVAYLAERLIAQITALKREIETQSLRIKPSKNKNQHVDIYNKIAQHQDYERRLYVMIYDRETTLTTISDLTEQQKVQKEIVVLEGRLQRCRQALQKLEGQLNQ